MPFQNLRAVLEGMLKARELAERLDEIADEFGNVEVEMADPVAYDWLHVVTEAKFDHQRERVCLTADR